MAVPAQSRTPRRTDIGGVLHSAERTAGGRFGNGFFTGRDGAGEHGDGGHPFGY